MMSWSATGEERSVAPTRAMRNGASNVEDDGRTIEEDELKDGRGVSTPVE